MKKIIIPLIFLSGTMMILLSHSPVNAQSNADIVRKKFLFYYIKQPVRNPGTIDLIPILLNNKEIGEGTEEGLFWSNPEMHVAQDFVRDLFKNPKDGGDEELQNYATEIVKIINKPVLVYIYDDASAPLWSDAVDKWGMCLYDPSSSTPTAWPCASNQSISDDFSESFAECSGKSKPKRSDDALAGYMHLGAFHMNRLGLGWTKETFLHELVHTQDLSDSRLHLFWVGGDLYRYGADSSHYPYEAIPNRAMTYKEGIANTISMLYAGDLSEKIFNWFAQNKTMMVEINPLPLNSGHGITDPCIAAVQPAETAWLYDVLKKEGFNAQFTDSVENGKYAYFKVRDLPAKYILHNEMILALTLSEYVKYVGFEQFMEALRDSNNELFRVTSSGTGVLFNNMCKVGLPEGESIYSISNTPSDEPMTYLLPLAYADYFTGFNASDLDEFKELFEGLLFDDWAELYWEKARSRVRSAADISQPKYEDLIAIAQALNIYSLPYRGE